MGDRRNLEQLIAACLLLFAGEEAVALTFYMQTGSMARNSLLLGLSGPRLVLGAVFIAAAVLFGLWGTLLWRANGRARRIFLHVTRQVGIGKRLVWATGLVWGLAVSFVLVIIAFESPIIPLGSLGKILYVRVRPLLLWGMLLTVQVSVLLAVFFRRVGNRIHQEDRFTWSEILSISALPVSMTIGWGLSILAEGFRYILPALNRVRGSNLDPSAFLWILLISVFLVAAMTTWRARGITLVPVLALCALAIQFSFGFVDSFASWSPFVLDKNRGHNIYAMAATRDTAGLDDITHYEREHGQYGFLSTKPPGMLGVHILLGRISNAFFPSNDEYTRYVVLSVFDWFFFPLLATLVIPAVYVLLRGINSRSSLLLPASMIITAPSFFSANWSLDQALYPTLFTLGMALVVASARRHSLTLAFLTGVYCYLCAFTSFSLLALIPLALGFFALYERTETKSLPTRDSIERILLFLLGFGLIAALFYTELNYDPSIRYRNAMASHIKTMHYHLSITNLLPVTVGATVDFALGIGMTSFALWILAAGRSTYRMTTMKASPADLLGALSLLTFLGLLFFGHTRIETYRLWFFLAPVFAVAFSSTIGRSLRHQRWLPPSVVAIQLVSAFLIFNYQYPY